MRFSVLSLLSVASLAVAGPALHRRADVHCGTTADATLSDCEALINNPDIWNGAYNTGNTCAFSNPSALTALGTAYNLACHGDCCVYGSGTQATPNPGPGIFPSADIVRQQAGSLLGCANRDADKINVMGGFTDHHLCISNGNGCGDCFDDSDWA